MSSTLKMDFDIHYIFRVLVGKPEGRRSLGRPRHRREDNITMDLQRWDVSIWTG